MKRRFPRLGQITISKKVAPRSGQHPARVGQRGRVVLGVGVRIESLRATGIRLDRVGREEATVGGRVIPSPQIGQSGLVIVLSAGPGEETAGGGRDCASPDVVVGGACYRAGVVRLRTDASEAVGQIEVPAVICVVNLGRARRGLSCLALTTTRPHLPAIPTEIRIKYTYELGRDCGWVYAIGGR